jgi:ATP-dependent RNA helicase RhlE
MAFKALKIAEPILQALAKEGYTKPTPIQEKTIPLLLENNDVIGIAQTGTGKTAAFVVPILQKLYERPAKATTPRALVLAPTRELAAQISTSFETYGAFLNFRQLVVYGGVGIGPQIKSLRYGVDILIATPGRLLDLMSQRRVDLSRVEFFVLDEADRMLDMGFLKDVNKIASALPQEKQSLFFSATMSSEISELTRRFLRNPIRIEVTPQATPVEKVEQCVFFVDPENKNELLLDLIEQQKMKCILVFVGAKYKADKVAMMLRRSGIKADAIHGNKSQSQRDYALRDFKTGRIQVLVATDIAARGIDIEDISHVINYDLPNEPENYVHRIGRTARAGKEGTAYSFCSAEERNYLHQIERKTKQKIEHADHKYHSLKAKNAEGDAARPRPRGQQGRGGGHRGGGRRFGGGSRGEGRGDRREGGGGGHSRAPRREGRSDGRDSRRPRFGGRGRR